MQALQSFVWDESEKQPEYTTVESPHIGLFEINTNLPFGAIHLNSTYDVNELDWNRLKQTDAHLMLTDDLAIPRTVRSQLIGQFDFTQLDKAFIPIQTPNHLPIHRRTKLAIKSHQHMKLLRIRRSDDRLEFWYFDNNQ